MGSARSPDEEPAATAATRAEVLGLVVAAFGPDAGDAMTISDANQGRGVFSRVVRVELARGEAERDRPERVIVKMPAFGPNGEAARRSGACAREALAYRSILSRAPVRAPLPYLVETDRHGSASFVLEDLGPYRAVDQLDGLDVDDGASVARALRRFHDAWATSDRLAGLVVRRATPSALDEEGLRRGLDSINGRWAEDLGRAERAAFTSVFERRGALADAFAAASGPTLCHGDPRADNLVFDPTGEPVLFDWQQLAIQLGEADLAWLAATSFGVDVRRSADELLVAAYGTSTPRYRLGFVLPGLTVLLLAQRQVTDARSVDFIRTSLQRIGAALVDLEVASI